MRNIFIITLLIIFTVCNTDKVAAQTSNIFQIVDAKQGNFGYSYAPSIIKEDGKYHIFFCSQGDPAIAPGSWDFVRYVTSTDGRTWTTPVVKLISKPHTNSLTGLVVDFAACDPSIVYFQGYYYMYYSNAVQTSIIDWSIYQTQISVARSATIDGEYLTYTERKTWEKSPSDPAYIISPANLRSVQNHGYGAGQQSVVAMGDQLYLWYRDDSDDPNFIGAKSYFLTSNDPVKWNISNRQRISLDDAASTDVKYDAQNEQFVVAHTINHSANSNFEYSTSKDGVNWTQYTTVLSKSQFTPFVHNVGLESDQSGHLLPGQKIFAFGAPIDLSKTDTWGSWNLYGVATWDIPPYLRVEQLLENPDFESPTLSGWISTQGEASTLVTTPTYSGKQSLQLYGNKSVLAYQDISGLKEGSRYLVRVYARSSTGVTATSKLYLHDSKDANIQLDSKTVSDSWVPLEKIFTATSSKMIRIHLGYDPSSNPIYYDNVEISLAPATLEGDLNGDGKVNVYDFVKLLNGFNTIYTPDDFSALLLNYGK